MSLPKLTTDLANIIKLDPEPNDVGGLTDVQLQGLFDKAGLDIQAYVNDTLTVAQDTENANLQNEINANNQARINDLNSHKISGDHDTRYYTQTKLSQNSGTSGASLVGVTSISGVSGNTVQDALQSVQNNIQAVSQSGIADGSVTDSKLSNDSAQIKTRAANHIADSTIHITSTERTSWNNKLNSSSYTAGDVLTKIKTVGGSGSGLDADTLDGVHASFFPQVLSGGTKIQGGSIWAGGYGTFTVTFPSAFLTVPNVAIVYNTVGQTVYNVNVCVVSKSTTQATFGVSGYVPGGMIDWIAIG